MRARSVRHAHPFAKINPVAVFHYQPTKIPKRHAIRAPGGCRARPIFAAAETFYIFARVAGRKRKTLVHERECVAHRFQFGVGKLGAFDHSGAAPTITARAAVSTRLRATSRSGPNRAPHRKSKFAPLRDFEPVDRILLAQPSVAHRFVRRHVASGRSGDAFGFDLRSLSACRLQRGGGGIDHQIGAARLTVGRGSPLPPSNALRLREARHAADRLPIGSRVST